ncbi:hypothetical protein ACFY36_20370 [Actinoplanes sp. NPDC000266]
MEVISRAGGESFRVLNGENVVEGLDLNGVEDLLGGRGIRMETLRQIDPAA